MEHDQGDRVHLIKVKVKLHAGWRVTKEVPLVLSKKEEKHGENHRLQLISNNTPVI